VTTFVRLVGTHWCFAAGTAKQTPEETPLRAAFQKFSEENYVLACRFYEFVAVPVMIGLAVLGQLPCLLMLLPHCVSCIILGRRYIEVTGGRIKASVVLSYFLLMMLAAWAQWSCHQDEGHQWEAVHRGFIVLFRAIMVIMYMSFRLHLAMQVCFAAFQVLVVMSYHGADVVVFAFMLEQVCLLALVLTVAALLELLVFERLRFQLRDADEITGETGAARADVAADAPARFLRGARRQHSPQKTRSLTSATPTPTSQHLQEVKMVLDCRASMPAVLQVHLRYSKGTDEKNHKLPNLRNFVQPTDWPSIQEDLMQYVRRCLQNATTAHERFSGLGLRTFEHCGKYITARHVEVSPYARDERETNHYKVWLHLKDFVHHKSTVPFSNELEAISEDQVPCAE